MENMQSKCRSVQITWADIMSQNEWQTIEDFLNSDCEVFESKGEIVEIKKGKIYLVCTQSIDGKTVSETLIIPVGCVVKMNQLNIGEDITEQYHIDMDRLAQGV